MYFLWDRPVVTSGNLQLWSRQQKQARNLENYVSCIVADVEIIQLISVQPEVFFEPTSICIADVGLILMGLVTSLLPAKFCSPESSQSLNVPRYLTKTASDCVSTLSKLHGLDCQEKTYSRGRQRPGSIYRA